LRANADSSSLPPTPVHIVKSKKKKYKKRLLKRAAGEIADEVDDVVILSASQDVRGKKPKLSCSLCGVESEKELCNVCERAVSESDQMGVSAAARQNVSPKMIVATRELQLGAVRNLKGVETIGWQIVEDDASFVVSPRYFVISSSSLCCCFLSLFV
jgi:hypothetical protein